MQFVCAFSFTQSFAVYRATELPAETETAERLYELIFSTHNEKKVENISV